MVLSWPIDIKKDTVLIKDIPKIKKWTFVEILKNLKTTEIEYNDQVQVKTKIFII